MCVCVCVCVCARAQKGASSDVIHNPAPHFSPFHIRVKTNSLIDSLKAAPGSASLRPRCIVDGNPAKSQFSFIISPIIINFPQTDDWFLFM